MFHLLGFTVNYGFWHTVPIIFVFLLFIFLSFAQVTAELEALKEQQVSNEEKNTLATVEEVSSLR